jgi:tripartite motif-containing protein 71
MLGHLLEEAMMITLQDRSRWPESRKTGFLALWTFLALAGCGGDADDEIDPQERIPPELVLQWGSTGAGDGQFQYPTGVAVDRDGNVYVSDGGSRRIQKFTSEGQFLAKWSSPRPPTPESTNAPGQIAVDASGNVFATYDSRVEKYSSSGQFLTAWGRAGSGDGEFNRSVGIDVDAAGNVYVADYWNHRIQKFTSDGAFLGKWGSEGNSPGQFLFGPYDLAVHANGNVYATDTGFRTLSDLTGPSVMSFKADGAFVSQFRYGETTPEPSPPTGLAIDNRGHVYVVFDIQNRIQKFTSDGRFLTGWGSKGSGPGQFFNPRGIAVDSNGNIYVVDTDNHRIQKFR